MKIFLDDSACRTGLFPFTHTRHVADIRVGILTIREKWEKVSRGKVYTEPADKVSCEVVIKANLIPSIKNYEALLKNDFSGALHLEHPWQIFEFNDRALREDYELLTNNRKSVDLSISNRCIGSNNIFIEAGAEVDYSILNSSTGPIYIGRNARVMEGSMIRGPFSMGENSVLKMGTKVYGATTLGPFCTAGGEIKNTVMFGYSNKAHDGYLGDSVIGEWCNLGAGTSNSNVKNTGGEVKYFLNGNEVASAAGQKGGVLMGDYSRAAINTSFNTASVVGVCCNIFGNAFPPKYIPNFSWGGERYDIQKALVDIANWKKMKGQAVSEKEKHMLFQLYELNNSL